MDMETRRKRAQQGYSLAEVLVATAIFTVIFIAALMIYDRSNKVFKESVEAGDMQQSTRVAFDQLTSDLRMTGFDFDRDGRPFGLIGIASWQPETTYVIGNVVQPNPPNGHAYVAIVSGKSDLTPPDWPEGEKAEIDEASGLLWQERGILQYQQPDEQLEYMGANAITVRGNLDYEIDGAHDNGREADLESEWFPVVTTNNDEIVTYALKSADSSKNDDTIVFFADVAIPRNVHPAAGEEEAEIKIEGVDLTNDNPPYTLYRYTINAEGEPDAGTPIADNIRSINYRYFRDTAGSDEVAPNAGAGKYDAAAPAETVERVARREIRSIHVDLVGMNPQPDIAYTNPDDAVVPRHRTYRLEAMIVPRNLGRRGMKQISVEAPGKPTMKAVCSGNCDVGYVTWEPPTTGEVITYNILYDKDDVGGFTYLEDVGNTLEAYVSKDLVPDSTLPWFFKVQAVNPHGFSTSDDAVSITILNRTKPATPTTLAATNGAAALANQIDLAWTAVTENDPAAKMLTCSDGSSKEQKEFPGKEKHWYHLYRSTDPNFDPDDPSAPGLQLIVDDSSTLQPTLSSGTYTVADATAANCKDYYYRLQIVDYCHTNANWNDPADAETGESGYYPAVGTAAILGRAESTVPPAAVTQATILGESNCAGASGTQCDVKIGWTAVTKDTGSPAAPIAVDSYEIEAEASNDGGLTWTPQSSTYTLGGVVEGTIQDQEKNGWVYRYRVRATQCGVKGEASAWVTYPCDFTSVVTWPPTISNFGGNGSAGAPFIINAPTALTIAVAPGAEKIEVWTPGTPTQTGSGLTFTATIPSIDQDVPTPVYINVTESTGKKCSRLYVVWVEDEAPPSCPSITVDEVDVSGNKVRVTVSNNSIQTLTLERIQIVWNFNETPSGNKADISAVSFDGVASTKLTDSFANNKPITTEVWQPSSAANTMSGLEKNVPIEIQFSLFKTDALGIVPVDSICLRLKNAQNDTITCGITVPGNVSTACTIP
jgi:hypothetical protein